jgi:hypothetical protein
MEQKVNVWKANLTNGLILALAGITISLLMYFLNLLFNQTLGYVTMLIQIVVLFFLVKSYRDTFTYGHITYGQALGAGIVINIYSALIMVLFTYILYTFIDPGLTAKKLAFVEEMMLKKGTPQASVDIVMKMQEKLSKPLISSIINLFSFLLIGTIYSLIIGIFVKKEGNPLLDTPEN